jgi:hypothetical protein
VTAIAFIEDSSALVGTSQLLCVVADFLTTTLFAGLPNDNARLHILVVDGLHFGPLRAQGRRESVGLGVGDNGLGRGI